MTEGKPICPACGGETFKKAMHCPRCLEAFMKTMTPSDWDRAIGEIAERLFDDNGEERHAAD